MDSSEVSANQIPGSCNFECIYKSTNESYNAFIRQQQNWRQLDSRNQIQTMRIGRLRRINDPNISKNHNLGATHVLQHVVHDRPSFEDNAMTLSFATHVF